MKTKSMVPFWVVGAISAAVNYISNAIVVSNLMPVISSIVENPSVEPTEMLIVAMYGAINWIILIAMLGTAQFILAIIHLVFYSKKRFTNNDSKVGHALYQLFFGLGLIGLLVVLFVTPKSDTPMVIN
ncbi:MAG: hypothetical protein RBR85_00940 [Bacilli bacterium]|jgi:hypothetical protein|nr:hypothetical protein [Bacilli bacterium]